MSLHLWNAFFDECQKIAAIDTSNLNSETSMSGMAGAPTFETAALKQARNVLSRADAVKTAGAVEEAKATRKKDKYVKKVRPYAKAGLTGMGVGTALTSLVHPANRKLQLLGAAVGTAGGVADRMYTNKVVSPKKPATAPQPAAKKKTATIMNPSAALKGAQKIGRFGRVATTNSMFKAGPSIKQQTPLVGRAGALPK